MDRELHKILHATLHARETADSDMTRICDALIAVILACGAGLCTNAEDCLRAVVDGANGRFEHEGTSLEEMIRVLECDWWRVLELKEREK